MLEQGKVVETGTHTELLEKRAFICQIMEQSAKSRKNIEGGMRDEAQWIHRSDQTIGLVRPLTGYMILAIVMGLIGHLCATFITILGGYALLNVLHLQIALSLNFIIAGVVIMAILRGVPDTAEQMCNHYIAFKLLALIRNHVFKLCANMPAKLEGKE